MGLNRFSIHIPCSFESWLYKGVRSPKANLGVDQQLNTFPGVGDPIGHRLDTWGVGSRHLGCLLTRRYDCNLALLWFLPAGTF
jgi:hypothetical protein